jgi:dihydrofolate reductase
VACSLDGYIATPDGGIEWLAPFEVSGEDYGYGAFYASIDSVVLGSRTFEQALTFGDWPYAGRPAWVMSKRDLTPPAAEVIVTVSTPEAVVDEVSSRGLSRTWLVGGGALAGSFQAAGLITEYIVSIMPVALGDGVPLLGGAGVRQGLRLLDTVRYADGVLQVRYAPEPSVGR